MFKVKFNSSTGNPFNGMPKTLSLYQKGSKVTSLSDSELNECLKECNNEPEKMALLSILLFSFGDVPRNHHTFGGKRDLGGYANRSLFRDTIVPWMWKTLPKALKRVDMQQFLWLVYQYTNLETVLSFRAVTKKKTSTIEKTFDTINLFSTDVLAKFCSRLYHGSDADRMALSKYLTLPKSRKGIQTETAKLQKHKSELIKALSDLVGLKYVDKTSYTDFIGYRSWRKQYNSDLESVMFTTGRILDLDKPSFMDWMEKLPSAARFRVVGRLNRNTKYVKLKDWYAEWEKFKETKQADVRKLEEQIKQGVAGVDAESKLKALKKEGKVNVGATTIKDIILQILSGKVDDPVQVQSVLDKIELPYNTLVIIDESGSMDSGHGYVGSSNFTPRQLAAGIATVCLMKNPDDSARNLIGTFSTKARFFNSIESTTLKPNRLLVGQTKELRKPLIVPTDGFVQNYKRIKGFLDSVTIPNDTNVRSIADEVSRWLDNDPTAVDYLSNYPVWTLISDGNFNNLGSASASLGAMFNKLEQKIGFRPYLLMIDVAGTTSQPITNFTGMLGIMMVPPSPENITMMLTNFKDMDIYDVYTPLLSLWRTNRYDPIKQLMGVSSTSTSEMDITTAVVAEV